MTLPPISEAENYLVNVGDWIKAPPPALTIVKDLEQEYGGGIAIGKHPDIGWFVLHDNGGDNGKAFMWKEI